MKKVHISPKAVRELSHYAPWVYRSDILEEELHFEPGEIVELVDQRGNFVALAYINPKSTIAARVLSFKNVPINRAFFKTRLLRALARRVAIDSDACRLVHSEGDFLPGLIVDRYGEYLSVQFTTAGMLRFYETILDILVEVLTPAGMLVRGEEYSFKKEGLEPFVREIGEVPERVVITEHGVKFAVDLRSTQKTGFYLDQRRNRNLLTHYIKQRDHVLDCFSNTGGFGLYARVKKKAKVCCVDISAEAIELAKRNFDLNEATGEFVVANVFDYLRELRSSKERFDLIILDPPSFAKSRSKKSAAMKGFKDITVNAMKVVRPEGLIALFSCSHHVGMEDLKKIALQSAKDNGKMVEVLEHFYQDIDHPYVLGNPYSLYLEGLLLKVIDL